MYRRIRRRGAVLFAVEDFEGVAQPPNRVEESLYVVVAVRTFAQDVQSESRAVMCSPRLILQWGKSIMVVRGYSGCEKKTEPNIAHP